MRTSLCIDSETLIKLKKIKIAKRESYDEVINRLIKFKDENQS